MSRHTAFRFTLDMSPATGRTHMPRHNTPTCEDTRRLRRMLAKGRARILSATVAHRAGRWTVSPQAEAADRTQPTTPAASPATNKPGAADNWCWWTL